MIATLSFVIENMYNRYIVLLAQWSPTFVTWPSSSPNQFVPEVVSFLPCSSGLVRHILLFVYFFKELNDKCHTSILNALISYQTLFLGVQEPNTSENFMANSFMTKRETARSQQTLISYNGTLFSHKSMYLKVISVFNAYYEGYVFWQSSTFYLV